MSKRVRLWSCLVIDPAGDWPVRLHTLPLPPVRSGDAAAVAAEVARLLNVPEGREPILLRSKVEATMAEMQVWLMDYRDARNEEELGRARSLPPNHVAWELLAPLGYHTIMREQHFRGRVLVTGPSQHLSVAPSVAARLVARHRRQEPRPDAVEDAMEVESEEGKPSPRDDYALLQERIVLVRETCGRAVPSVSF
jgi:hypothetical protein